MTKYYNQTGTINCKLKKGDPVTKIRISWFRKVESALNNLKLILVKDLSASKFLKDPDCKDWQIVMPFNTAAGHTLVVCTDVDSGGDGYHQFTACGLDGVVIEGGTVYENCRLIGDWVVGTWLPVEYGLSSGETPTYGKLYIISDTYAVEVLGSYYMD